MNKSDKLGTFRSQEWGTVAVYRTTYADGALAVVLESDDDGEPLAKLSVNLSDSLDLPLDCFYVKDWSENMQLATEALKSGLFILRAGIPSAHIGSIVADVWQIKE
jgi:hypothetical protein